MALLELKINRFVPWECSPHKQGDPRGLPKVIYSLL